MGIHVETGYFHIELCELKVILTKPDVVFVGNVERLDGFGEFNLVSVEYQIDTFSLFLNVLK